MINLPATIAQLDAYSADLLRTTARHTQRPAARTIPWDCRTRADQPRRVRLWLTAGRRRPLALTDPTSP